MSIYRVRYRIGRVFHIIAGLSILIIILTTIPVCVCAKIQERFFDDDSVEPWHISADELTYDQKADQYVAKGNVIITKRDRKLTADFVRFNYNTMEVLAVDHVIMAVGDDVLIGDRMEMDLEAEIGTIYNGTVFLKENHFYIKGKKIKKLGKNSYFVDKASLTSCDGESLAWKVTGRNLKVTLEGMVLLSMRPIGQERCLCYILLSLFFQPNKNASPACCRHKLDIQSENGRNITNLFTGL